MRLSGGAFAASIDADSEGHEGRFYVWTRAEVIRVLGEGEGAFFAAAYDISDAGNWEGVSIPNRLRRPRPLERRRRAPPRRRPRAPCSTTAPAARRLPPTTRCSPTGTASRSPALAAAGTALDRPDWIDLAIRAYAFVAEHHDPRRPPGAFLARRQDRLSRPCHRLRRARQGGARPLRRHLRSRLARPRRASRRRPCGVTTGTATVRAFSSPPTTPRPSSSDRVRKPTTPRPAPHR